VRELKNAVERSVILANGPEITVTDIMPRHLRLGPDASGAFSIPVGAPLSDAKRQLVLRTFAMNGGDLGRTARMVGIPESEVRAEILGILDGRPPVGATAGAEGTDRAKAGSAGSGAASASGAASGTSPGTASSTAADARGGEVGAAKSPARAPESPAGKAPAKKTAAKRR
jgi:hypothetical protein